MFTHTHGCVEGHFFLRSRVRENRAKNKNSLIMRNLTGAKVARASVAIMQEVHETTASKVVLPLTKP